METLWGPNQERIDSTILADYQKWLEKKYQLNFKDYGALHKWSVEEANTFWSSVVEYFDISLEGPKDNLCDDFSFKSYSWGKDISLNFAENLLKKGKDSDIALAFRHESGLSKDLTFGALKNEVAALQGTLKQTIGSGDVVACYMPNIPETVSTMLAATALGAQFTSTSADFGVSGVVDRFGQSKPKVLVTIASYEYNGKRYSQLEKLKEIIEKLPSLEKIIVVDFLGESPDLSPLISVSDKVVLWSDYLSSNNEIEFVAMPFDAPLYIMYSSGTTGKPKCIVHSAGGTLLQHVKELGLHTNLSSDKTIFFFTTCGWMMWNWLVSSLFFGAKTVLFEGSPGYPTLKDFFQIIEREKINYFGTSPKFLRALEDSGYEKDFQLESLETILSTGAPLLPEQYDFIYEKIKSDCSVSSISGGTDIIGCFMLGLPTAPVYKGEIQALGLGMNVQALDEFGNAVIDQEGELVCAKSFPSRPLYFLSDDSGERIKDAYFETYPGLWHHGDFIKITPHGGVLVYGRSDATLNPGGVRIGTAEIYRQTEPISWIEDGLCVGRQRDGDVEVVLFVKLVDGVELTDDKVAMIKKEIRAKTTPRHVPKDIYSIQGIPYTRSGKKMELAVTRILAGKELKNIEAVANPECLEEYKKFQ